MAKKLKGMKKIEKTSEHIEIIKFSSWNNFDVSDEIGIKAT
jgi:hypothetical protein